MVHFFLVTELVIVAGLAPWFGLLAAVLLAAIAGRIGAGRKLDGGGPPSACFLIVIPAHDEAEVIGTTVKSCRELDYPPDRFQVFVIADNCTDATASIAQAAGAEVVVRSDPARKSKGYALEDFFRGAGHNPAIRPFDAYVLVDADTSAAKGLLRAFDRSLDQGADFIQGYYTVRNADASWRTRLMTYAFSLANGVWLAGTDALGQSVGLKGNGMCFRALALERSPWRAHGLVEDMEFAWTLRVEGERVRFQPDAIVYGEMVSRGGSGATSQRRRWESGRKALRASVRPLLRDSARLTPMRKVVAQVELNFPPLSRLVVALSLASMLSLWGIWETSAQLPWAALGGVLLADWAVVVIYAMSPLFVMGLPFRYLFSLAYVPYYMIWKLTTALRRRPDRWVRTPRETVAAVPPGRFKK